VEIAITNEVRDGDAFRVFMLESLMREQFKLRDEKTQECRDYLEKMLRHADSYLTCGENVDSIKEGLCAVCRHYKDMRGSCVEKVKLSDSAADQFKESYEPFQTDFFTRQAASYLQQRRFSGR